MKDECPDSRPYKSLVLPDYRLVFRGTADIIPANGHKVYGALYVITPECRKSLDNYENSPYEYRERTIVIDDEQIIFFDMKNDFPLKPPKSSYLNKIKIGYDDWRLPFRSLNEAVRYTLYEEE